ARSLAVGRDGHTGRPLPRGPRGALARGRDPGRRAGHRPPRPRRAGARQAPRRARRPRRRSRGAHRVAGPRSEPDPALGGARMTTTPNIDRVGADGLRPADPVAGGPGRPSEGPIRLFGRMIKFEHTLFALPFALAAAAIAARGHGLSVARIAGIVVAMAGARNAAMGFNRIVDRHIDAKNPRTAGRELPTGEVLLRADWALTISTPSLF